MTPTPYQDIPAVRPPSRPGRTADTSRGCRPTATSHGRRPAAADQPPTAPRPAREIAHGQGLCDPSHAERNEKRAPAGDFRHRQGPVHRYLLCARGELNPHALAGTGT